MKEKAASRSAQPHMSRFTDLQAATCRVAGAVKPLFQECRFDSRFTAASFGAAACLSVDKITANNTMMPSSPVATETVVLSLPKIRGVMLKLAGMKWLQRRFPSALNSTQGAVSNTPVKSGLSSKFLTTTLGSRYQNISKTFRPEVRKRQAEIELQPGRRMVINQLAMRVCEEAAKHLPASTSSIVAGAAGGREKRRATATGQAAGDRQTMMSAL
ncbi:hypothetical protein GGX14DRAFT_397733 [Mycena pura]|uniref:Uncharacterized protein n=1 Tax=Mycena pura TaxID=153505 RepID=A0AAD6YA79_9AGAR|nr:hypothetical protein GGX14DRAFT_397733 [Mycena pura]